MTCPSNQASDDRAGNDSGPGGTPDDISANVSDNTPLASALYLVSTPIGNVGDLSARAGDVLGRADLVACEDTRVTGPFLKRLGIGAKLVPYHDHNARTQRPRLIERLKSGESVALVSDAGTPLVSDPGYKLVRACIEEGIVITAIPGASSVLAALAVSGLPTDRFFFQGFLPPKSKARRDILAELAPVPATLVIMESAKRLAKSLTDMADVLGPRPAAMTRELTKKFEEVRRGTLSDLAAHYTEAGPPKGEVTLVIGPPEDAAAKITEADIDAMLRKALAERSVKDAATQVAEATGRPRRTLYTRALELKDP